MRLVFSICFLFVSSILFSQPQIRCGAERMDKYLQLLIGKRVGVFANQTAMVGQSHLVDTLIKQGIHIACIFGPEHGFRGEADAGEKLGNDVDLKTGIPVISLYGAHKKPTPKELENK